MATRDEVAKVLSVAMLGYPSMRAQSADETARMIQYYALKLADIPAEIISAAIDTVGGAWFPSVYQIREAAAQLMSGQAMAMTALEAWGEVKRAAERFGRARQPQFSDPIIGDAVRAMGWVDFCNSSVDDEPSWRARFCECYEAVRRRELDSLRLTPEAVRINDESRARIAGAVTELARRLSAPGSNGNGR